MTRNGLLYAYNRSIDVRPLYLMVVRLRLWVSERWDMDYTSRRQRNVLAPTPPEMIIIIIIMVPSKQELCDTQALLPPFTNYGTHRHHLYCVLVFNNIW